MLWPRSLLMRDRITLGRVGLVPYSIPNSARDTHVYCIGASGTGKSKFLEGLFVADVRAKRGCGLIDPHGDLAHDVLANLLSSGYFNQPNALEHVIYFDPTRTDYTLPFNALKLRLPPYTLANQIIEAFRRAWPQSLREAPRFTNIALGALLALIEANRTLVDMPRLLTDATFREEVLAHVNDPQVVDFFHNRYDQWGRGFTIESVLNKVTAFTLNPHLRRCLGTPQNALDLRHIMDAGKVLIVNLGHCDDETRRLIGSLITTGFEQAAMSRAEDRRHFYLYLDEFQDFCANDGGTQTLAHILSECRKYNLHIHMAHQTLGQIQSRVESALANVNVKVVFALDYEDAKVFAHKLFVDYVGNINWEQATATIQKLRRRTALVKWRGERLAKIKTLPIPEYQVSAREMEALMAGLSRTHGLFQPQQPVPPLAQTNRSANSSLADWETEFNNQEHVED
jgi:hypothetical protein